MSARPEADEANYPERRTVRTVDARPMRTSRLFDALPPYLGGKRRLVPLILADLAAELPAAEWPGASFCDPMCGGGAVALAAKAQGFEVYASDRARRGAIVAAALIANSSVRLREADWLPVLRPDDLRANGTAAVSVFTPAQARRIDGLLTAAAARQAPTRALLELLAIKLVATSSRCRCPNATDAARAAAGEYDTISPRRLGHYLRRDRWIQPAGLRTLATAINGGVIGGRGHATQRDAREAIAASPAEVIYLDPPQELTDHFPLEELATLLPEDADAITQTLTLIDLDPEALLAEQVTAAAVAQRQAPRVVSFAVTAADEGAIEAATARSEQPGFLIRDRDRSYGGDFIARARRIGIETILTPVRAPNANAIAERVIGTLRRECLDHVIAVNERHLRRVLGEYVQHYNAMRPHRSLALDSPEGRKPVQRMPSQRVDSKPLLGGLHHEYRWAA